jgi:hypothetical protein
VEGRGGDCGRGIAVHAVAGSWCLVAEVRVRNQPSPILNVNLLATRINSTKINAGYSLGRRSVLSGERA